MSPVLSRGVLLLPACLWLAAAAAEPAQTGSAVATEPAGFTVVPRQDKLRYFPCKQCHQFLPSNHAPRELYAPHLKEQDHGGERFWCLTCHDRSDRDRLATLNDATVGFDQSYLVCEQCHAPRARDWRQGGHGKRVGSWNGEREIYSCTECHDPHDPPIDPVAPDPPPPPRIGFPPPRDHGHSAPRLWEALLQEANGHGE